jgi:hypothetical protein
MSYSSFAKISCSKNNTYACLCAPQYLDEIYPEEEHVRDQVLDRIDHQANLWLPDMVFMRVMLFDYDNMLNRESQQLQGLLWEMEEKMKTDHGG